MKYLYDFKSYLIKEAFDLNRMYKQQNIIPEIQEIAKELTNNYFNGSDNIPVDMQKSRDKVELWVARQIKDYAINYFLPGVNTAFANNWKVAYEKGKACLDIIKGKAELSGEYVSQVLDILNHFKKERRREMDGIFDYFLSPIRNPQEDTVNLITADLAEMNEIQIEWHKRIKASGKIYKEEGDVIKSYPDGYYWIDLNSPSSTEEADAMGHCGRTNADTILSLRKKSDAGYIEPFVTIAIDYGKSTGMMPGIQVKNRFSVVHQIKGKGNTKPVAKYHKYIVDLLMDDKLDIQKLDNREYSSNDDFHISDLEDINIIKEFLDKKPNIFNNINDLIKLYKRGVIDESFIKEKKDTKRLLFRNGHVFFKFETIHSFHSLFAQTGNGDDFVSYGGRFLEVIDAIEGKHPGFENKYAKMNLDREYVINFFLDIISKAVNTSILRCDDKDYPYMLELNDDILAHCDMGTEYIDEHIFEYVGYYVVYVNDTGEITFNDEDLIK